MFNVYYKYISTHISSIKTINNLITTLSKRRGLPNLKSKFKITLLDNLNNTKKFFNLGDNFPRLFMHNRK